MDHSTWVVIYDSLGYLDVQSILEDADIGGIVDVLYINSGQMQIHVADFLGLSNLVFIRLLENRK